MPNWTRNKLVCKKEVADKILKEEDGKLVFDFNKVIPMPESLSITSGSIEYEAVASYFHSIKKDRGKLIYLLDKTKDAYYGNYLNKYNKKIIEFRENKKLMEEARKSFEQLQKTKEEYANFKNLSDYGKQYIRNIKKYGCSTWYDWCCENWGTKWNACYCNICKIPETDDYIIEFSTAWAAPVGIIKKVSEMCKDKEFLWEYENEDYDGTYTLTKMNGEIVEYVEYLEETYEEEGIEV